MDKVLIDSLDALLIFAGNVENGAARWENATISNKAIIVPVVTQGKEWDKRIDSRGAMLIQNIQKLADKIYSTHLNNLQIKAPKIKVEARNGSNGLDFDVTSIFKDLIARCPAEDVSMIIYALIGCGFGLATVFMYFKHKENIKDKQLIEKALDANKSVTLESISVAKEFTAPLRRYISSLADKDTISIAGSEYIPSPEATKLLRQPRKKLEINSVSCDGQYLLTGLVLKHFPPALALKQGGADITALLERLDAATRGSLIREVEDGISNKTLPKAIGLQIDVYYTEREIKYATIISIDKPRPGIRHYRIEDVPSSVKIDKVDDEDMADE